MINFKVCAVLPAGGAGERAESNTPKQFHTIDGKHLVCYSVEVLERVPWISKIVVVVALDHIELMQSAIQSCAYKKTTTVAAGSTRHRSIAAGIRHLRDDNPEIVVVHDAVRPLIPIPTLTEVVLAAKKHGAAGAVRPLVSTVVAADTEGFLTQSLDRTKYVASEMPQAFQYSHLVSAYEKCTEQDYIFGTECLQLTLKYCDVRAKLIEGPSDLWKVTYKKDVYAIDRILKEVNTSAVVTVNGELDHQVVEKFSHSLSKKVTIIDGNQLHTNAETLVFPIEVVFHVAQPFSEIETWCLQRLNPSPAGYTPSDSSVHILVQENVNQDLQQAFSHVKRLTKNLKEFGKTLYFIWEMETTWDESCIQKLADLVAIIVLEKRSALSGQLFTLP